MTFLETFWALQIIAIIYQVNDYDRAAKLSNTLAIIALILHWVSLLI